MDVDLDEVWEFVQDVIQRRGKHVLGVAVSVDSPAGSGGWSVTEWEGAWWIRDWEGCLYGPLDPTLDAVKERQELLIDEGVILELSGTLARPVLERLSPVESEDGLVYHALVNGEPFTGTSDSGSIVWQRA